jgi:hypothetical protein
MPVATIPLFLHDLTVKNFRGIEQLHLEELPDVAPWIFLTGENSFGKTTLLQAMALGLNGYWEDHTLQIQRSERPEISVGLTADGVKITLQPENLLTLEDGQPVDSGSRFITQHRFAAYGAQRTTLQAADSQNKANAAASPTYGLFKPDGMLKNIEYELLISSFDNTPRFEAIIHMLKSLIPSLHDIAVKDRVVWYTEKDEDGKLFPSTSFDKLAMGAKGLVAMAGDIYLRLSGGSNSYQQTGDLSGIVLIDELDAHLHPKWQRKIPGLLSAVFPKVQFIASTHSPIPLLGAPEGSVFFKVHRSVEEGVTVARLDVSPDGLTPNVLLTSPLFDFDDIVGGELKNGHSARTEDFFSDLKFHDRLNQEVAELAKKGGSNLEKLFGGG